MEKQLTKASSWRKDTVVIKGQSSFDYDFLETNPNSFYVLNRSDNSIYIGIKDIPTKTRYEHIIQGHTSDVFGQPDGTKKLYFYNDSVNDITLDLYSYGGVFDITVLKKLSVVVNGEGSGGGSGFDGIIRGFTDDVSLPSGTNLLGRMVVQNAKEIGNWLESDVVSAIQFLQNMSANSNDIETKLESIRGLVDALEIAWTGSRITQLLETIENVSVTTGEQVAGKLYTNALIPTEDTTIIPDEGYTYFDRITYLRANGGDFTFHLVPDEGMTVEDITALPELTLTDGESINDFVGRCYGIYIIPTDGSLNTGKIELVASMK